jgi:hypothetical protein
MGSVSSAPPQVRYIKLGPGNAWARRSIERGEIHFDHREVSHDLASTVDRDAIVARFMALGRTQGKARDFAREILDFYTLGPDAVWITFAEGRLWWARSEPSVTWLGDGCGHGARVRSVIGVWSDKDARGKTLRNDELSTRLTKVAAYRQTICGVEAKEYLLRRLAAVEEPVVTQALEARKTFLASASDLIASLHWVDFETLIDLILARNGWHRISPIGGSMKDADLIVEQTVTGETAMVQVKSKASQATVNDYIDRFDENPAWSRMFFCCHSPTGNLNAAGREDIILWTREALAATAVRNGLFDWLLARAS